MDSSDLKLLLEQYLNGTLPEEEFRRLWNTLKDETYDAEWLDAIEQAIISRTHTTVSTPGKTSFALEMVRDRIYSEEEQSNKVSARILQFYHHHKNLFRAAAAILIIASAAVFLQYRSSDAEPQVAKVNPVIEDIEPGGEKAILTLADGSKIVLDNSTNGQIAQQGHVQIIKLANGEIQYKALSDASNKDASVTYNTMSTPRGGQYQLLLPDGSKVWLNAESSITYPIAFSDTERRVQIAGEVYFEVAKDKIKPFRVSANDAEIEVLGTQFNIKAYPGDGPTKTSLLEGSVKINKQILKPGQAFMNGSIVRTNIEQDVAWKNGIFNFDNQDLTQVMLQLARWYDLEVIYPAGVPQKEYGGEIGRNLKLAQVLKGLGNSGVRFELAGKKVVITPTVTE